MRRLTARPTGLKNLLKLDALKQKAKPSKEVQPTFSPPKVGNNFRRSGLPNEDLTKLALSYLISTSLELKEVITIISRWHRILQQNGSASSIVHVKATCSVVLKICEDWHGTGNPPAVLRQFVQIVRDTETIVAKDQEAELAIVFVQLGENIQTLNINPSPLTEKPSKHLGTFYALVGHSSALLSILKDAADFLPIPGLQNAISAAIGLVALVQGWRANSDDLETLSAIASSFLLLVAEETHGKALDGQYEIRIRFFTQTLESILLELQSIKTQSLGNKLLNQHSHREVIKHAFTNLKFAIEQFQLSSLIQQKRDVEEILSRLDYVRATIEELDDAVLMNLLQINMPPLLGSDDYFPGSSDDAVDAIRNWLDEPDEQRHSPRNFTLQGPPASGKSTIVRHVLEMLRDSGQLATFLFFGPNPNIDLHTAVKYLAYQLASLHPTTKRAIAVAAKSPLSSAHSLTEHFQHLVVDPLKNMSSLGRLVIVIDGVEEYIREHEMLKALGSASYPDNVRLLVTKRSEPKQEDEWRYARSYIWSKDYTIPPTAPLLMEKYICGKLSSAPNPIPDNRIADLVNEADGHMGWASFACSFIQSDLDPEDALRSLLHSAPESLPEGEVSKMNNLYQSAISRLFPDERSQDMLCQVLGIMVVIHEPMTLDMLQRLLSSVQAKRLPVETVNERLRSLQTTQDTYITPISRRFHRSFRDFITRHLPLNHVQSHRHLFECCSKLIGRHFLRSAAASSPADSLIQYALNCWAFHAASSGAPTKSENGRLCDGLNSLLSQHGRAWIRDQLTIFHKEDAGPEEGLDPVALLRWFVRGATSEEWWTVLPAEASVYELRKLSWLGDVILKVTDQSGSERIDDINALGIIFNELYQRRYRHIDLQTTINLYRTAVQLQSEPQAGHSDSFTGLANALWTDFHRRGEEEDLNEAISLHREALSLHPSPSSERSNCLSNLAVALRTRAGMQQRVPNLWRFGHHEEERRPNMSYEPFERELPPRLSQRLALSNVVPVFFSEHDCLGDLNESIDLHREALQLRQYPHPNRALSLSNLAIALHHRFRQLNEMEDLEEVIQLHREALQTGSTHPTRSQVLNNLAYALNDRFRMYGLIEDLDEVVEVQRESLKLRPSPDPSRCEVLNNLAVALQERHKQLKKREDLAEAVELYLEVMGLQRPRQPDFRAAVENLLVVLRGLFDSEDAVVPAELSEAEQLWGGIPGQQRRFRYYLSSEESSLGMFAEVARKVLEYLRKE